MNIFWLGKQFLNFRNNFWISQTFLCFANSFLKCMKFFCNQQNILELIKFFEFWGTIIEVHFFVNFWKNIMNIIWIQAKHSNSCTFLEYTYSFKNCEHVLKSWIFFNKQTFCDFSNSFSKSWTFFLNSWSFYDFLNIIFKIHNYLEIRNFLKSRIIFKGLLHLYP